MNPILKERGMAEVNGNGVLGKVRTVISAGLFCLAIGGVVYASGTLNQRVTNVESQVNANTDGIKQLDDKKADKREIDDIHKQLDRIENKLDRQHR